MTFKAIATLAYGIWLIVNGALRFAEAQSVPALGFGLAMGILAIGAALLMFKEKRILGYVFAGVVLLFVVGFFVSKSMKEGFELRVVVTLLASVLEAIVLFMPKRVTKDGSGA